ncbi:MAG: PQQ-binding-like beta-propeller repeat protein [Planctomycetes bacterium]|nr:PQQ-binding-like beta-propeller repeat protein [Planctomycetota bacterium]
MKNQVRDRRLSAGERTTRASFARLAAGLLGGLLAGGTVFADEPFDPVFLPTSDEVDGLALETVRRAANSDWRGVAERFQALLEKHPQRILADPSATADRDRDRYLGTREWVRRRAGEFGDPALAAYRTLYDPFAEKLVSSARDAASLECARTEVVLRYPLATRAQADRCSLAGIYMERGEFELAAANLVEMLRWGEDPPDPQILAKLAFAYRGLGDSEALFRLAEEVALSGTSGKVQVGDAQEDLAQLLDHLAKEACGAAEIAGADADWQGVGGSARRTFASDAAILLSGASWTEEIPEEGTGRGGDYEGKIYQEHYHPRHYPVIAGGEAFVNSGVSIFRYNLYTGARQLLFQGLVDEVRTPQEAHLVYGLTYHDGHLFANLEGPTAQRYEVWQQFQIQVPIPQRHLVKFSIEQGKEIWDATQQKELAGEAGEFLEEASFSAPPVVMGGVVYSTVSHFEGFSKIYVVALDETTGALLWKTLVCTGQEELNMFGRPVKELVATTLAAEDGVLYCLTNLGVACALDAADGRVRWLARYERIEIPITQYARVQRREPSWANCPPLLSRGVLVVAPLDSSYAYAYDARTGELEWKYERGSHKYLLSVTGDRLAFGGRSIDLVDLANGKVLVRGIALDPGDEVMGHAVASGEELFVPGRNSLYRVDGIAGRVLERRRWGTEKERGNLLAVEDVLLSAGTGHLSAFSDPASSLKALENKLAKRPGDPALRFKLASLFSRRGQHPEATEHFRRLVEAGGAPGAEERDRFWAGKAAEALFSTYLALAEKAADPAEVEGHLQSAKDVATDDASRVRLLFRLAEHYVRRRQTEDATAAYRELARTYGDRTYFDTVSEANVRVGLKALTDLAQHMEKVGRAGEAVGAYQEVLTRHAEDVYLHLSGRELARRRIDELIKARGREIYRAFDEEAARALAAACGGPSPAVADLKQILDVYPNAEAVELVAYTLAETLSREKNERSIEEAIYRWQRYLGAYPDSPRAANALAYLVLCYEGQGRYTVAKSTLELLAEKHRGATLILVAQAIPVAEFVDERLVREEYRTTEAAPMPLEVRFGAGGSLVWEHSFETEDGVQVFMPRESPPAGVDPLAFAVANGEILAYTVPHGDLAWRAPIATSVKEVRYFSRSVLVLAEDQILALAPSTGRLEWEYKHSGPIFGVGTGAGFIAVTLQVPGQGQCQGLMLLDASGRSVWQEEIPGQSTGEPVIASRRVVVWSQAPGNLHLYDLTTGTRSDPLPAGADNPPGKPAVVGGRYVALTLDRSRLVVYDLKEDRTVWQEELKGIWYRSLLASDKYTIVTDQDRRTLVYETATGRLLRAAALSRDETPEAWSLDDETLYSLSRMVRAPGLNDEILYSRDLRTGDVVWRSDLVDPGRARARFLVARDHVIAVCDETSHESALYPTTVFVIAKEGGKKVKQWEIKSDLYTQSYFGIAGGRFLIGRGRNLYAYGGD